MAEPPVPQQWEYRGELVRVIDGDTVVLRVRRPVDFGFRMQHELSAVVTFRLAGIDTPELVGATRAMGEQARDFLHEVLRRAPALSVLSLGEPDKYGGRWDAEVYSIEVGRSLNVGTYLVACGYAQRYTGKGPRPAWDAGAPYPLVSA